MKMWIKFDDDRILRDGKCESKDFYYCIDKWFEELGIYKDDQGMYVGGDFASFGGSILKFSKTDWFMKYIKEWIWYSKWSTSKNYIVEDLVEHYKKEGRIKS